MAPVSRPGTGKPRLKALTVIVEVGEGETDNVCFFMPRVRDAVLVELFRQPIVLGEDSATDVEAVEARLLDPLNRVLGSDAVRRVYLIPGSEHMAKAAVSRLPMSRVVGCKLRRDNRA